MIDDSDATNVLQPGPERYCPTCDQSFAWNISRCPSDGTALIALGDEESLIGREVDGRFTIEEELGRGGMGVVYRANQHSIGRNVTLKVVHRALSRDPLAAKRFLRETKLASSLSHPHTVTVLDFGQLSDRRLYMVMEHVDGENLQSVIEREKRLAPDRAVAVAIQICEALEAAHAQKIIHRDLKPSNVMLMRNASGRDYVKVLDFGLAKSLAGDSTKLTQTDLVMGTPFYISPEVATGGAADERSDLYSLGAMLFELIEGAPPFTGTSAQAILYQHVQEPPPPLGAHAGAALAAVVDRLLAKRPDNRFASATAARAALQASQSAAFDPGESFARAPTVADSREPMPVGPVSQEVTWIPPERGKGPWIAAALVVAGVAIGGGLFWGLRSSDPARQAPPPAAATPAAAPPDAAPDRVPALPAAGTEVDDPGTEPAPSAPADAGAKDGRPTKPSPRPKSRTKRPPRQPEAPGEIDFLPMQP